MRSGKNAVQFRVFKLGGKMKSVIFIIVTLLCFHAKANVGSLDSNNFHFSGSHVTQILDGETIASGNICHVTTIGNLVYLRHNARIQGWDVSDIELRFDLSKANATKNGFEYEVGTVRLGYCGDNQSARGLVRYIELNNGVFVFGEKFRCSLEFKKTTHEHRCAL